MKGFTLIELLVVIAIMAILTVVAIPSYNEYSRSQKLNDAASQLQTVLRQAQNNAQTGTVCKISGGTSKALYWHVDLTTNATADSFGVNTAYKLFPDCESGSQVAQMTPLPPGIIISSITFKNTADDIGCSPSSADVRFLNVSSEVKLHDDSAGVGCPDTTNKFVEITLCLTDSTCLVSSQTKTVTVEKGGGIYVKQ